jgi:hypothetical protein
MYFDTYSPPTTWYRYFIPKAISNMWGEDISTNKLLSIIYEKNGYGTKYLKLPIAFESDNNSDTTESNSEIDPYEDYRQVKDFHQRLLLALNDMPEVLSAKNWVFYVEGPEQLIMIILFFIGLFHLIQRYLIFKRDKISHSAKTITNRRWLRWITVSMPLFGFIGTKRGLSEALSQSDRIIRAGNEINQSMALSEITYSLGIAFTTTLVALVLSLILSLLEQIINNIENVD